MEGSEHRRPHLVAGLRHMNAAPTAFRVELLVESVDSVHYNSPVVVTIARNKSVLSTRAVRADAEKRAVLEQTLTKDLTLYKQDGKGRQATFQDKYFDVAVRSDSKNGGAIGEARLNIANYVEEPSSKRRIGCKLSNGSSVVMTISASATGATLVDDEASGRTGSATPRAAALAGGNSGAAGGGGGGAEGAAGRAAVAAAPASALDQRRQLERLETRRRDLENENLRLKKEMAKSGGGGGTRGAAARNALVNVRNGNWSEDGMDPALVEESERLSAEVKELQRTLEREPKHGDIMAEMQKVTGALVQLGVEKEAAETELRNLQQKRTMKTMRAQLANKVQKDLAQYRRA